MSRPNASLERDSLEDALPSDAESQTARATTGAATFGNAIRGRRLPPGTGEDVVHVALPAEGPSRVSCWPSSSIPVGGRRYVARIGVVERMKQPPPVTWPRNC